MKNKRIAIVYDWIDKWGGAERVLLTLSQMYPNADFYTSYCDYKKAPWAKQIDFKTSFIQKLPEFIKSNRTLCVSLYPFAFESLNFSSYDVIISLTSSFAKSIVTRPDTLHICYMLSPTRFLWDQPEAYPSLMERLAQHTLYTRYLKTWDRIAANRPDKLIGISKIVCKNIKKYYQKESETIYPPFDIDYWNGFKPTPTSALRSRGEYYLVVSRLEQYKRIDLVIKTFNKLNKKLIIIGSGSQLERLKGMAGKNITFVEKISDAELADYYSHAKALILPQKEEFGYTALEAQFFGCPVISYAISGAAETIVPEITGILFPQQTELSLTEALEKFELMYYTLSRSAKVEGLKQAEKFRKEIFIKKFNQYIESNLS
ncbi:MAG: glycosyltransferase [Microgenomates group bacterium]